MHHYALARQGDDAVEQIVRYSSSPPPGVLARWSEDGFRLVKIRPPQAAMTARQIARAPHEWKVLDKEVARR